MRTTEAEVAMTQVKVTGVEALGEEKVEAYFSNKKKSGGGDIADFQWREREAIITFEEDEAASRVLFKRDHVIDGQPVGVELYNRYATDDVTEDAPDDVTEETLVVRVTGLSSDVDGDTLTTYFESKRKSGGGDVVGVEWRKQGREALVTFQKMEVAQRVLSKDDHKINRQPINVKLYDPNESDDDVTEEVAVVKVTGLPAEVEDELLESYFGSKRKSGGGEVVNLERRKRGRESLIYFEDAETAQRVVSKFGHKIKGQPVTVELYNPEDDVTKQAPVVKVTDLPPDVDDEAVQSYFESKRKSGGGDVANFERRKRGREAIITFENMEDAQRVASRSQHEIIHQPITVELFDPDDDVTEPVPIVKVTGLTPEIDDEQLETYFGSKRTSGGGDVANVERRKKGREAIITFEEMEVAQRVVDKSSHAIKNQPITVELYDPDDDVIEEFPIIRVTGLPPDMEDQTLETYFESKRKSGGGEVVNLERRKKGREAIVTFKELEVAKHVASKPRHDIKGQQFTVELYDPDDDVIVQVPVVKVTGLRADMDDEALETYFESKRTSGGGDVEKIERRKRGCEALVTFQELEVAQRVASKSSHVIRNQSFTVELYDPDDDVTEQVPVVKVAGLPPDMDDETVQAYFENKRKSGGGEVVTLLRKKRGRGAIVTFENMEDAERVLGRDKHTLGKAKLTVAALDDEEEEDDNDDEDEGEGEGAEGGPGGDDIDAEVQDTGSDAATSTVKVTGHDESLTEVTLNLYMENEKKSGGGEVKSMERLPKENAFLITFQSPKVAQRVADKGRHALGGQNLQVRLYTPPPMYEDRVLVQGVPEGTTQDTLNLFLENVSGLEAGSVLYGDQPGDLLVSFEGKVDFAKMQDSFRKKKLGGQQLSVTRVEVTRCVAVRPVKDKSLLTTLELHFENEKRSGGKDVESIDFFSDYQQAVVKFEDHHVAERVSRQRQKVGEQELEVSLHHECLGPSGGSSEPVCYSLPEPLQVADVDSRKATYVEGHAKATANLKKALDHADADFQVQDGRFVLLCTIPEGTKLKPGVAKEWGGKARSVLHNFLKDLAVEEIAVSSKMIQSVLDGGKKGLKDWPKFSLMESPKGKLSVVGPQDDMVEVKKVLDAVITDVQRQQNLKTEELAVKSPAKLQLLKAAGVPPELKQKCPQLKVDFSLTDQKVLLHGTDEELMQGKLTFLQQQEALGETPTNLTQAQVALLKEKEAAKYLTEQLSRLDHPVMWMEQGGRVYLLTLPGADSKEAEKVLQKSILQTSFPVPPTGDQMFSSSKWTDKLRQFRDRFHGTWVLSLDDSNHPKVLHLTALATSFPIIEKDIRTFLSNHGPRQSPPSQRNFPQHSSPDSPMKGKGKGPGREFSPEPTPFPRGAGASPQDTSPAKTSSLQDKPRGVFERKIQSGRDSEAETIFEQFTPGSPSFENMNFAGGGEWACPKCTYLNVGGSRCKVCEHSLSPPTEKLPSHGSGSGGYDHHPVTACAAGGGGAGDSWTSLARDELRIVLLGHTGCGKSATGNCILDKKAFQSKASAKGVTALTKQDTVRRFNRTLYVVDTPGLFDPCMTNDKVITEITKCFGMTAPGPHAFILVVYIGRFTKEEKDTVEEFKNYFGPFMMKYLLVLFTRTDDLEGGTLRDYVSNVPAGLEELLQSCGHRYIGFNNKASAGEKEQQVQQLLRMIDDMVKKNGGTCYTNEMYQEAEKTMRRREKAIRDEMEQKKRDEIERIEVQNAVKLSEVHERYQQKMNDMQVRMRELQGSRGDESSGLSDELKSLKEKLDKMTKEKEQEEKQWLKENARKVDELEAKYQELEDTTRTIARKEVEGEAEGFGLVWQGIKSVAKGLFQGVKNSFFERPSSH